MSATPLAPPADMSALPTPDVQGEWREFWDGTARGELLIQDCPRCGKRQFYPRIVCTGCGGEPRWLKASGRGSVHTFSVIRQNLVPPFKAMVPYVLAIIDLDEGVRMMSNIVDCALEDVHIGMRVKVRFVESKPGVCIPYWGPERD